MSNDTYSGVLKDTLQAAKERDYAGYGKFDALNSSFISFLTLNNSWLRLFATQFIKMSPFNLRPVFNVKKSRNAKGIALFARAYLFLYQSTNNDDYLAEARNLLDWLLKNPSNGINNLCWGYNFVWQDIPPFLQRENEPNVVVTVFAGEAFIHAYRITNDQAYLEAAQSVANFITTDLPVQYEDENERAISYIIGDPGFITLNVQLLSAAFLVKVWKHTQESNLLNIAKKQATYTVSRRTDYNAWYYTYPSTKSHIKHDNYHTGGIVDAILEFCEESGDDSFMEVYWNGLEYYKDNLFENNGAPRWMNDSKYPHDIHGAAQGIISFAKAGVYKKEYHEFAKTIASWAIEHLYKQEKGEFIYRQGRFMKWDYTLMRWCNGWMTRALGELIIK